MYSFKQLLVPVWVESINGPADRMVWASREFLYPSCCTPVKSQVCLVYTVAELPFKVMIAHASRESSFFHNYNMSPVDWTKEDESLLISVVGRQLLVDRHIRWKNVKRLFDERCSVVRSTAALSIKYNRIRRAMSPEQLSQLYPSPINTQRRIAPRPPVSTTSSTVYGVSSTDNRAIEGAERPDQNRSRASSNSEHAWPSESDPNMVVRHGVLVVDDHIIQVEEVFPRESLNDVNLGLGIWIPA